MGWTVRTTPTSTERIASLHRAHAGLEHTLGRLSADVRVNDKAALTGDLDASQRELALALRNANDGLAVLDAAESAVAEVRQIVNRMRELAVQSSSRAVPDQERSYLQDEFLALSSEVDRIATDTQFNGVAIADGSRASIDVNIGLYEVDGEANLAIALADLTATTVGVEPSAIDLTGPDHAQHALSRLDSALSYVDEARSEIGANQHRIYTAMEQLDSYSRSARGADARIADAPRAMASAEQAKHRVAARGQVAVQAQATRLFGQAAQLVG